MSLSSLDTFNASQAARELVDGAYESVMDASGGGAIVGDAMSYQFGFLDGALTVLALIKGKDFVWPKAKVKKLEQPNRKRERDRQARPWRYKDLVQTA